MLLALLVLLPALLGLLVLATDSLRTHLTVALVGAVLHLGMVISTWIWQPAPLGVWLHLDEPGRLFLSVTSVLFLGVMVYTSDYLLHGTHDEQSDPSRFVPCLLWFLATMSLVEVTTHLALLWVGVEATTLASAPLIYFYRRREALEAAWKYLLICSVGIALALLGTFCLGVAAESTAQGARDLSLADLSAVAPYMDRSWLKAGFVCALVGYGTKMGLVPMHTWLPDAHSQAPSPVSAMMSGSLLNCALLAILRFFQVALASGDAAFARELLLVLGFASVLVPAAFLMNQHDYKRLFAYSSIENMGVISIGVGLGGTATYGAMLHVVNHSLTKAALFLVSGTLLRVYRTTEVAPIRGAIQRLPVSGPLMLAGILAIGGLPPFGTFMSEFTIFQSAVGGGAPGLAVLFLLGVATCFLGVAMTVLPMLQGENPAPSMKPKWEQVSTPLAFLLLVLLLGLWVPPPLSLLVHQTAAALGG